MIPRPAPSPWRARSAAFQGVELGLALIGATYGVNLILVDQVQTPTIMAVQRFAPLPLWGAVLLAGASLIAAGFLAHSPWLAITGHSVQTVVLTTLGVVFVMVNPLNDTSLILGLLLHPLMAITIARDLGRALGATDQE